MAYVAPSSRTTGTLITSAIWNQDVVDNVIHLASFQVSGTALGSLASGTKLFSSWHAYESSSNQTVTANVTTKLTWNAEDFDTDSVMDIATNERATPDAGKWVVYAYANLPGTGVSNFIELQKNGTSVARKVMNTGGSGTSDGGLVMQLLDMNGTDYVESYVNSSSTTITKLNRNAGFGGFKVG